MSHPVMARRTVKVWDPGVRIFHWLLVISIAVAFLSSEEEGALAPWHIPAGWVAAVLIVFRLIWGLVGGEHARFANFIRPSKIAAHLRIAWLGGHSRNCRRGNVGPDTRQPGPRHDHRLQAR